MEDVQYNDIRNSREGLAAAVTKLKQREERIGIRCSLVDIACCSFPDALPVHRPVVSLKALSSDFVVREQSLLVRNGEPLRMESIPMPEDIPDKSVCGDHGKRPREEPELPSEGEVPSSTFAHVKSALGTLLSETDLDRLLSGLRSGAQSISLHDVSDKAQRSEVHKSIRACLGTTHVSSTDQGVITVAKANSSERREDRRRSHAQFPRNWLHFTLYKENLDSNHALRLLAKHLGISVRQVEFSGTKDKRAVTLQRVAIRGMDARRLLTVNQRSFGTQTALKVCSFNEEERGLRLGDAIGNYFSIALRYHPLSPVFTEVQLRHVERCVSEVGVVNYYGSQRFGTTDMLTSDIGALLLQGSLEQMIMAVLISKSHIVPDMRKVIPLLADHHFADALSATPHYCYHERDILGHLVRHPNDWRGALQCISRSMAMLYVHAVQSLVWNRMASKRLEGSGRAVAEVGDMILEEVYQLRRGLRPLMPSVQMQAGMKEDIDEPLPCVHYLTQDDVDSNLFTLSDVLLTLPGPDDKLQYPRSRGCTEDDYCAIMSELGVRDGLLDGTNPLVKIFHYHGAYRVLCVRPEQVHLEQRVVSGVNFPVQPTDLELLRGEDLPKVCDGEESSVQVLLVSFSLPAGSYATSVLRELCYPCLENVPTTAEEGETASPLSEGQD